ncbi:spermidine dehydrogenase [Povalibacter uvarum]|uniref:Spermidine dehydrogenase n=1 Tax=Povalibacter uvarum TaxID=732238 RepID=A0A841HRZ2_9GAMM|nr:NAD(P)/FAD-dependent oxidoreductase [Povalibacter uvarum]MBB6094655.1 spermidine dehydrogenase [Povalibacter uvarum]
MPERSDKTLGMHRVIARRDFLQGAAIGVGGWLAGGLSPELLAATESLSEQDRAGYYPPARMGLRGSHPGSFESAHLLRDTSRVDETTAIDTRETYDLIVVGAGISGLAAAHYFHANAPRGARVLVLDNHDDFGGHAKRNEFRVNGRTHLMNGGTLMIESPRPYGAVAADLMRTLGVDAKALDEGCTKGDFYDSLGLHPGVFFDRETFGTDRLVARKGEDRAATAAYLAQAPLSEAVRRDILRIEHGEQDYFPGLTSAQKKDRLSRMSYERYLLDIVKADPGVLPYYLHATDGWWGCGIDAISALDCWGTWYPGFQGLDLESGSTRRMGFTPSGFADTGGSGTFHYPDGNASIARLLVRRLIPGSIAGRDARDIVTATADYSKLDRPDNRTRIRLNSTALRVRNEGNGVAALYSRDGKLLKARASHCVLACWNMMIPYLCPELPAAQKAALHQLIKTPLVYASVALRNWRAFHKLGVHRIDSPGGYFSSIELNEAVEIGGYRTVTTPDEPILIRMVRTPAQYGLPEREQHRAGRAELLATPFETFERNIRDQLGRALSAGGFDPARDIEGIAVNRWPHGYAPEYNCLVDGDTPPDRLPNIAGRKRFGRIAIANSDSAMAAYTDAAIEQAHRAVKELLG